MDSGALPRSTVLLVEDDDILRGLMLTVLARAGFHVLTAATATEALTVTNTLGYVPAVLVTDQLLPDMDGTALALALTRRWETLRVVLTSGRQVMRSEVDPSVHAVFLRKPFGIDALVAAVSR